MIDALFYSYNSQTVRSKQMRTSTVWLMWFMLVLGLTAVFILFMFRSGPSPSHIAWLVYLIGIGVILINPRYGIYLILFWGLMGDEILTPWFPFVKNFSSIESLLYLHDALIINPLETYIVVTFLSWFSRSAVQRKIPFYKGPLFWPAMIFAVFIIFGFVYGVGTGGDIRIAIWEGRAILYIPIMLVLVSNMITKPGHMSNLIWVIMIALFIEGLTGIYYIAVELNWDLDSVQSITAHSAAIQMNTLFIFALAIWIYKGSKIKRILMPLMVPVVALTYVATQRRAAFLTLVIALSLLAIILYKENRLAFWLIMPPLALMGILYIGAFWNNTGAIGMPAQAVKGFIAPDQASEANRGSDIYRILENFNSSYTIHARPLTGVGFGQKFYMAVQLPDISFFEFWEYITHNSIMWIWMKSGVGGFTSMIFLVAFSLVLGVNAVWQSPGGDVSAVLLIALLYLVMHFLFAYVDMSWEPQSMIYVGAAMGLINRWQHFGKSQRMAA